MDHSFEKAIEKKKSYLIDKLISHGIYKKDNIHLFELSLIQLEGVYCKVINKRMLKMQIDQPIAERGTVDVLVNKSNKYGT